MLKKLILVAIFCMALPGCTVKYQAVGVFDDYNETFIGDLNHDLNAGTAHIVTTSKQSKIRCEGDSYVTYKPRGFGCSGQRGKAPLRCSDGRRMEVDWIARSCTSGFGEGRDQFGNTFRLIFGLDEQEALLELGKASESNAAKPDLPAYRPKEVRKEKGFSTGTGFFVSTDGVMVTNFHVIDGAKEIMVVNTVTNKQYPAKVLRVDSANDIAIIKIDEQTQPIPLAKTFTPLKGEEVIALGYPLITLQGQEQKATFGRVNALSGVKNDGRYAQIDVPIQPGNSGGPLLNRRGEIVGIVTATLSQMGTLQSAGVLPQNVNFAVKVDYVLPVLRLAITDNEITYLDSKAAAMDMTKIVSTREPSVMLIVAK